MSTRPSSTRSYPGGAALAAFVVSTLTMALIGCALIGATVPFAKTSILNRRLEAARAVAGDPDRSAQALAIVEPLRPVLTPYHPHAVEGHRLLARAYAARGRHDEATAAAKACYRRIVSPPSDHMQRVNLPTRWGARLYHRITGEKITDDPWIAYRDARQQYEVLNDDQGLRHIRKHLDRTYGGAHPWYATEPDPDPEPDPPDLAEDETDVAPVKTTAPDPDGEPGLQWALPLPGGAVAYNRRRERLREIPPDTLIDVHEHLVWDEEPMIACAVYVLNRWVSNIFLRTVQIALHDGYAGEISDREKRLHIQRLELLERIEEETQREPSPAALADRDAEDATAPAVSQAEARHKLRELEAKLAGIRAEMEEAQGPRRAELIDKLRRLRNERFRLQQAAAGVVETLEMRDDPPEPEMPPAESPRLERMRRQLADIETELQRLAESR